MKRNSRRLAGAQGFTLIEVLIVVAIIAILAAIAVPQLLGAREKARHAACLDQMHAEDGDTMNYMDQYENSGDPAAADKAIDDVISFTTNKPPVSNPRNVHDPGYAKTSLGFVPTADDTCVVFLYDASSTIVPPSPTVVLTQFEGRVRSYRIALH